MLTVVIATTTGCFYCFTGDKKDINMYVFYQS